MSEQAIDRVREKMKDLAEQARKAAVEMHAAVGVGHGVQQPGAAGQGTVDRPGVAGSGGQAPSQGGTPGYGSTNNAVGYIIAGTIGGKGVGLFQGSEFPSHVKKNETRYSSAWIWSMNEARRWRSPWDSSFAGSIPFHGDPGGGDAIFRQNAYQELDRSSAWVPSAGVDGFLESEGDRAKRHSFWLDMGIKFKNLHHDYVMSNPGLDPRAAKILQEMWGGSDMVTFGRPQYGPQQSLGMRMQRSAMSLYSTTKNSANSIFNTIKNVGAPAAAIWGTGWNGGAMGGNPFTLPNSPVIFKSLTATISAIAKQKWFQGSSAAAYIGIEAAKMEMEYQDSMARSAMMRSSNAQSRATFAARQAYSEGWVGTAGVLGGITSILGIGGPLVAPSTLAAYVVYRGAKYAFDWTNDATVNEATITNMMRKYSLGDIGIPAADRAKDWLAHAKSDTPEGKLVEFQTGFATMMKERQAAFRMLELGQGDQAIDGPYANKNAVDMLVEAHGKMKFSNWCDPAKIYAMFESGRVAARNYARAMTVRPALRTGD